MAAEPEMSDVEIQAAVVQLEQWPRATARELIDMQRNERELIALAAGLLDAMPVDSDGWPICERHFE